MPDVFQRREWKVLGYHGAVVVGFPHTWKIFTAFYDIEEYSSPLFNKTFPILSLSAVSL